VTLREWLGFLYLEAQLVKERYRFSENYVAYHFPQFPFFNCLFYNKACVKFEHSCNQIEHNRK